MFNKQGALEMTYTQEQINVIVQQAQIAAHQAAMAALAKYGDRDACGFAWTSIYKIKGNTKIGKMLKAAGVRQSYDRSFQLWNPAGVGVQSVGILEAGAQAAAEVFREYGFEAYAGSRLD
jgi:hypothetical protein